MYAQNFGVEYGSEREGIAATAEDDDFPIVIDDGMIYQNGFAQIQLKFEFSLRPNEIWIRSIWPNSAHKCANFR